MNAHGYLRYTKDADLVVRLVPDNIARIFAALAEIGYRPNGGAVRGCAVTRIVDYE